MDFVGNGLGRWKTIPYPDASYRQIREATRLVRGAAADVGPVDDTLQTKVKDLVEALPAPPPGTLRGDRVRTKVGKDGRVAVSFHAIPLDALPAFVESLTEHLIGG